MTFIAHMELLDNFRCYESMEKNAGERDRKDIMGKLLKKLATNLSLGRLVLGGFKYQIAKEYLQISPFSKDKEKTKKIMALLPFDSQISKLFEDFLTAKLVVGGEDHCHFPKQYAISSVRNGKHVFIPLQDYSGTQNLTATDIIHLLQQKETFEIRKNTGSLLLKADILSYVKGAFYINGKECSYEQTETYLNKIAKNTLIYQGTTDSTRKTILPKEETRIFHFIYIVNDGHKHELADAFISDHGRDDGAVNVFCHNVLSRDIDRNDKRLQEAICWGEKVASYFGEVEFFHMAVRLTQDSFVVFEMDDGKVLACDIDFSENICSFISKKQNSQIKPSLNTKLHITKKYFFSWRASQKGFIDYMYRNWKRGLKEDKKTAITTRTQKRWAHKRGFYSYRITQYGLTDENYKEFLSDYDYKRLRPINDNYQKWLWNKVHFYYVMRPFIQHIPKYWYRIVPNVSDSGRIGVFSFDDIVKANDDERYTTQNIIELLKTEERLVLKPAIGSHGSGYHKLEYMRGEDVFLVNGAEYTKEELEKLLNAVDTTYLVSEYIEMHDDLKKIYDKVTFTMRVMTIWDGSGPTVRDAYLRIAANSSGETDNVTGGGIVARVDLKTGRFHDAEELIEHSFKPCRIHPDTGVPLEGTIPHWNEIRDKIEEICKYLAPLEYLGFDIAVTQDGFKIIEINTHQDLHKYAQYTSDIKQYLEEKNQYKKTA